MLTCLTNCLVPDFPKLFEFLLQQTKAKALDTDNHEGNTFEQVKTILSKVVDAYHSVALQASGMLTANQVEISMLSAEAVRRKDVLLAGVLNQRIKKR